LEEEIAFLILILIGCGDFLLLERNGRECHQIAVGNVATALAGKGVGISLRFGVKLKSSSEFLSCAVSEHLVGAQKAEAANALPQRCFVKTATDGTG